MTRRIRRKMFATLAVVAICSISGATTAQADSNDHEHSDHVLFAQTNNLAGNEVAVFDSGPIDLATSADGKFLYVEAGVAGAIDALRVNPDGTLTNVGTVTGLDGDAFRPLTWQRAIVVVGRLAQQAQGDRREDQD